MLRVCVCYVTTVKRYHMLGVCVCYVTTVKRYVRGTCVSCYCMLRYRMIVLCYCSEGTTQVRHDRGMCVRVMYALQC